MKKLFFTTLAFVFLSIFSTAWANTPTTNSKSAQGIIENWFSAMKNKQVEQAGSYLAPQFTSIHTDNIVRDKKQELKLIKNLEMKNYQLSNFKFIQSGDAIVVTFQDKGTELIDNKAIATKSAGRMAVLQKQGNQWLILAYANLDKIS